MHWPRVTRDGLMFVLGAIGFMHEVFVSGPTEHPFLLAASAALMGLPFIFQGPTEAGPQQRGRWKRPGPDPHDGRDWEDDPTPAALPSRRPRRRVERDDERRPHTEEPS